LRLLNCSNSCRHLAMRATVELDEDTARGVEALRRDERLGLSEAVNELIRRGILAERRVQPFIARGRPLGMRLDVSAVAAALDLLEVPDRR
jgi:hypothetical protein